MKPLDDDGGDKSSDSDCDSSAEVESFDNDDEDSVECLNGNNQAHTAQDGDKPTESIDNILEVDEGSVDDLDSSNFVPAPQAASYSVILNSDDEQEDEMDAADPSREVEAKPEPKRYVGSARVCFPLQLPGLLDVRNDMDLNGIDPKCFRKKIHYEWYFVWGATSKHYHRLMGSKINKSKTAGDDTPWKTTSFSDMFKIIQQPKKRPGSRLDCDLKKYIYSIRKSDKEIWPKCNAKKVSSVKSAAEMMTSSPLVDLLRLDGILPMIKHPHKGHGFVNARFGPYLDSFSQPHPPGAMFHASSVYSNYSMTLKPDFNETWRAIPQAGSALIFRLPEKNAMTADMSPHSEMLRIKKKDETRLGFHFYRSGGNPSSKGQAPPSHLSKGAGEAAHFEYEQTIKNAPNMALELLAENGTPVAVFAAGPLVPTDLYDKKLAQKIDDAEQAFYFGCYRVIAEGEQPPMPEQAIMQLVEGMKPTYPKVESGNSRFLLKRHRRYRLEPIDYPVRDDGYKYAPCHVNEPRRPLFVTPRNMPIEKVFSKDGPLDFTEDSMITQWYRNGGLNEYLSSPFEPPAPKTSGRLSARNKGIDLSSNGDRVTAEEVDLSFRLLAPSESTLPSILAAFVITSCTQLEHWFTIMSSSIASFLRASKVNVDADGKIGPLLDYDLSFHKSGTSTDLVNYKHVFGDNPQLPYTGYLPLELQRSPLINTPC
jgi:hypothetical protein